MFRSLPFLLLLSVPTVFAGTVDVTITDCCDATCKGTIKNLNNPGTCPSPGDCKAGGSGTLNEDITDAKMELTVSLGSAKVLDKTVDACGHVSIPLPLGLGSVGIDALSSCPAKAGPITVAVDVNNKISIPSKITSHAVAKDTAGNTLLCLDMTFTPQKDMFTEFETMFGKQYESEDVRNERLAIFTHNLGEIEKFKQVEEGSATFSHLTPFADLTADEFSVRNGFQPSLGNVTTVSIAEQLDTSSLPDSYDWRDHGAVNPVKNQQQCGSCWAFATVANIEGAGFVANKKLLSLSEQELVDCDTKTGDQGCSGGLPSNAYKDMIQSNLGLELESAYPYEAKNGQCKAQASSEKAFISGYQSISTDEDQIAAALIKYGPLAIGINAGPMQMYSGGVAKPWKILCNPKKLDHGVAIVGFGVDSGTKYWTIRNSWGASWGEKGYYRIVRGTGACGLNTMVTTATGVTLKDTAVVV